MNEKKKEQADLLFRAFGEINDSYVQEALPGVRKKRRTHGGFVRAAALVAACLVVMVGVARFTGILAPKKDEKPGSAVTDTPESIGAIGDALRDAEVAYGYADESSKGVAANGTVLLSGEEELDFFDGNAYLVWRFDDSDALYRSRALTDAEKRTVTAEFSRATALNGQEKAPGFSLWILCGDGTVVTPYLRASGGNISYLTLFDYDPEVMPNEALSSCITRILS